MGQILQCFPGTFSPCPCGKRGCQLTAGLVEGRKGAGALPSPLSESFFPGGHFLLLNFCPWGAPCSSGVCQHENLQNRDSSENWLQKQEQRCEAEKDVGTGKSRKLPLVLGQKDAGRRHFHWGSQWQREPGQPLQQDLEAWRGWNYCRRHQRGREGKVPLILFPNHLPTCPWCTPLSETLHLLPSHLPTCPRHTSLSEPSWHRSEGNAACHRLPHSTEQRNRRVLMDGGEGGAE